MRAIKDDNLNIYIDIDETLTFDEGKTFVEEGISFIKDKSNKCNIFIWSQGGYSYALDIVKKADISDYIVAVLPKPDIAIDDLDFNSFSNTFRPNWQKINAILSQLNL